MVWTQGQVDPWWGHDHRDLAYIHEDFNNSSDVMAWRTLGFTQQRFTGDMYDMRFQEPHWIAGFRSQIPMRHFSWSVYRMRSGDVLPAHSDTYQRFCQIHQVPDIGQVRRYVVFLEHWSSGHYFEIDGVPVLQWQAGDWISWTGDTVHLAANLGSQDRYTLQLTGLDSP